MSGNEEWIKKQLTEHKRLLHAAEQFQDQGDFVREEEALAFAADIEFQLISHGYSAHKNNTHVSPPSHPPIVIPTRTYTRRREPRPVLCFYCGKGLSYLRDESDRTCVVCETDNCAFKDIILFHSAYMKLLAQRGIYPVTPTFWEVR